MIDHLELKTRNIDAMHRFYGDVLRPLGYELKVNGLAKGFGDGTSLDFFFTEGEPSTNIHYAFSCPNRAVVNRIYEVAQAAGHRLDREPALAPHIHANYYASYLRDPDDHLVEFVCHLAE
jgi:catechol 2,3-dioxygenase-like lactoylglutathione lyase family enzyme